VVCDPSDDYFPIARAPAGLELRVARPASAATTGAEPTTAAVVANRHRRRRRGAYVRTPAFPSPRLPPCHGKPVSTPPLVLVAPAHDARLRRADPGRSFEPTAIASDREPAPGSQPPRRTSATTGDDHAVVQAHAPDADVGRAAAAPTANPVQATLFVQELAARPSRRRRPG
jgi:hypothetical protein